MLRHHIANLNRRILQYQEDDTVNLQADTVNDGATLESDGVKKDNDGVIHLNKTLQWVYRAIANKPEIISAQLMESLHISESTIIRSTRELKKLGFIKRRFRQN